MEDDDELFALMREELYSAVIGDILDQMGLYHQFLPREIQPIREDMVVCGRAMTVREEDLPTTGESVPGEPTFGYMLDALDGLKKNEIYLCSGSSPDYAVVGELMCTPHEGSRRGRHGDEWPPPGYKRILALDFPVLQHGPVQPGSGAPWQGDGMACCPLISGRRNVDPGDIVFGDLEGVVIIPKRVEAEVVRRAWEKATGEKTVGKAIRAGMSATEAFKRYGIL